LPSVLFVCHGNICRSPMAETILRHKCQLAGLNDITVDSAGIISYHRNELPHKGTLNILREHGISASGIKSRPVEDSDFYNFDLIIAMDFDNIANLNKIKPKNTTAQIKLLSGFVGDDWEEVPDPWYTGDFNLVYQMIEKAMNNILNELNKYKIERM